MELEECLHRRREALRELPAALLETSLRDRLHDMLLQLLAIIWAIVYEKIFGWECAENKHFFINIYGNWAISQQLGNKSTFVNNFIIFNRYWILTMNYYILSLYMTITYCRSL